MCRYPLPPAPASPANVNDVKDAILALLTSNMSSILPPDVAADGKAYYGAVFVHLAYQCATTFRATDYLGRSRPPRPPPHPSILVGAHGASGGAR